MNIYCDESRHLLCEDGPMALGALAVPAKAVYRHNRTIREIKKRHGIAGGFRELKWSKVSPGMLPLYHEVVDYFFDQPDLAFRGILVPSKGLLDHARYGQTHNDWYYKMCFRLLERVIDTAAANRIYIDITDRPHTQRKLLADYEANGGKCNRRRFRQACCDARNSFRVMADELTIL